MPIVSTDEDIKRILKESKKVAVFGISDDPKKPAYFVPIALKERGFEIYGVNPKHAGKIINGIEVYSSLLEIPCEIDVVLVFRPPQDLPSVVEQAYLKGFKTFWMQPGTLNENVKEELLKKGYNVVFEKCMKVESEKHLH